jgi:hypothetical protein
MYFLNLFTIVVVAVWLAFLKGLQVAKQKLEPVRVNHKR